MKPEQRFLLLIRHAAPAIVAGEPARTWRLSAEGRESCRALAGQLARYQPRAVITSVEPKARETGELLAQQLGLPVTSAAGLHEHERERQLFLGQEEWQALVRRFFAEPDTLVFGEETAAQAQARFAAAVDRVVADQPAGNLAIVAHGTVMTLLLAQRAGVEAYSFWRALALPALIPVLLPDWKLEVKKDE